MLILNRLGVIVLMFDLPTAAKNQKRLAANFRKNIMHMGYTALQKSVYVKLVRNTERYAAEINIIDSIAPNGKIVCLPMSLGTFKKCCNLRGNFDFNLFSDPIIQI